MPDQSVAALEVELRAAVRIPDNARLSCKLRSDIDDGIAICRVLTGGSAMEPGEVRHVRLEVIPGDALAILRKADQLYLFSGAIVVAQSVPKGH